MKNCKVGIIIAVCVCVRIFMCVFVCECSVSKLVKASLVADSVQLIHNYNTATPEELPQLIACSPVSPSLPPTPHHPPINVCCASSVQVFPPTLQCGAMLLNVTLRRLVLYLHHKDSSKGKESEVDVEENGESVAEEAAPSTCSSTSSRDLSKEIEVSVNC